MFDPEMEFSNDNLIFIDPKKQEKIKQDLYKQMQIILFEQAKREKEFIIMRRAIQKMVNNPIKKHPIKKYRAYKAMLKTYLALLKENKSLKR